MTSIHNINLCDPLRKRNQGERLTSVGFLLFYFFNFFLKVKRQIENNLLVLHMV